MTTLIAEIGMNHDGRWDRAYEMIRRASLAGADVAKFQFGWRDKPGEINHITPELAKSLKDWCDYWEVEFMASVITDEGMDLAAGVNPDRYKIASRTVVDNPGLVKRALATGKEVFVSLGWWKEEGWPMGPPSDTLRYIYCVSEYPTYPEALKGLPTRFGPDTYYGYSDHFHGVDGCLMALSRGAKFIETHFTLDKAHESVHNDHILSTTPDEFELLNTYGRSLYRLSRVLTGDAKGASTWPKEAG